MSFELWVGIGGLALAILTLGYAIREGKRARKGEKKIAELEKAATSYEFLRDRAMKLYETGDYEQSLDVFRKYFLDHKDENEAWGIISQILRIETTNIFQEALSTNGLKSPAVLIAYYMMHDAEFLERPKYTDLVKELIALHFKQFKITKPHNVLMFALLDREYEKAKAIVEEVQFFADPEMNVLFKALVGRYCDDKLPATKITADAPAPDNFEDDIPF